VRRTGLIGWRRVIDSQAHQELPFRRLADKRICWIHLSDLHFCPSRTGYDAARVLSSLVNDVKQLVSEAGLRPDLVFFTGDLAFGELGTTETPLVDQFKGGCELLHLIRKKLRLSPHDVFLVPGNHDVERSQVTPEQIAWLENGDRATEVLKMVQQGGTQWDRYMLRLQRYREALEVNGFKHLLHDPSRLMYRKVRTVRGVRIGIAGLNSAWSSCRDNERSRLWMAADWQFKHLRSQLGDVDVSLALVHHPLGWLHESEREPALSRVVAQEYTFLLHGHEHSELVSTDQGHVRIAAAAAYDRSATDNGYNITRFDPSTGHLEIWLRKYEAHGGGWVPHVLPNGRTDNGGRMAISLASNRSTRKKAPARNGSPIRTGPVKVRRTGYDAFLALPMAAVPKAEYRDHMEDSRKVMTALREHCRLPRVFHPGESIPSPEDFDPPDVAVRRGLVAIGRSRVFVALYTHDRPSSVLVEAGFALAMRVPSIYFVKKGLKLPFLLEAAHQAFPDVATYEFVTVDQLVKWLAKNGRDVFDQLFERASSVAAERSNSEKNKDRASRSTGRPSTPQI
jgi:predicted MPP superfamily phosphohydrolase